MQMKLIVALVPDDKAAHIIDAAREAGATGATVITSVRGEGLKPQKTFLGLELTSMRDVVLFLVAEPRARKILERIRDVGQFETEPGAGVAFQIAIEDAVGPAHPVARHHEGDRRRVTANRARSLTPRGGSGSAGRGVRPLMSCTKPSKPGRRLWR